LFLLGALFALPLMGNLTAAASPQQADELNSRTITVVGEGQVTTAPDVAQVNVGVQVLDADAKVATSKAAEDMEAILAVLKAEDIADKDIETSYYNLYVDRPYGPQGQSGEPMYQVSNNVQVTIRDLDKLPAVMSAVIEAGANNINSVNFKLSDSSTLRSQAREKAIDNALETAKELAELNGVAVGQVVRVSEVIDNGAYFVSENAVQREGFGGGGAGPISPGDVNVSVQLQVTYAILQ